MDLCTYLRERGLSERKASLILFFAFYEDLARGAGAPVRFVLTPAPVAVQCGEAAPEALEKVEGALARYGGVSEEELEALALKTLGLGGAAGAAVFGVYLDRYLEFRRGVSEALRRGEYTDETEAYPDLFE
jgi:hypothetical protein